MQALTDVLHTSEKSWIYEAFQNAIDREGKLRYNNSIHINNVFTARFLKNIGFEWGIIDLNSRL